MMCATHHIDPYAALDPLEFLGLERMPTDLRGDEALDRLASDLSEAAIRWDRLGPYLHFDPASYCRTLLHRSPGWELVLVGWLPRQRSPVHDHGPSTGIVRLVLGELVETQLRRQEGGLERIRTSRFHAGEVMIERPGIIHQVESDSSEPAATLHLYAPPLLRMNRYHEPWPAGSSREDATRPWTSRS